jgi:hypothetical protein
MNGDTASSTSAPTLAESNRRATVLAVVGVVTGVLIMAVGLGLDVGRMGGLWSPRLAESGAPPPPLDLRVEGQADELGARSTRPTALRATAKPKVDDADAPAAPDQPDAIVPRGGAETPPANPVDATLGEVEDAITAILRPVVDLAPVGSTTGAVEKVSLLDRISPP